MKVEFKDGFAVGFKMAVPECFKDSLSKEQFNTGDIIYDDMHAYSPLWSDAVKHVSYACQVVQMVGDDIEFAILRRKHGATSLTKQNAIREPVTKFIERLQNGI